MLDAEAVLKALFYSLCHSSKGLTTSKKIRIATTCSWLFMTMQARAMLFWAADRMAFSSGISLFDLVERGTAAAAPLPLAATTTGFTFAEEIMPTSNHTYK